MSASSAHLQTYNRIINTTPTRQHKIETIELVIGRSRRSPLQKITEEENHTFEFKVGDQTSKKIRAEYLIYKLQTDILGRMLMVDQLLSAQLRSDVVF